tara:strand:- start:41 stop:799 length:759 start_codon:yes stop_codon:yes gene_type:complete
VCTESGTPKDLFTNFEVFSTQQRPDGKIWNDYLGNGKKLSFIDILNEGTKLIVIYRDGRDCFVSARQTRPDDIQEMIKQGKVIYSSSKTETTYWYSLRETEKWLNSIKETFETLEKVKGTKHENNYLVIRYEDLVHNPEIEMKRVEAFVGWSLDPNYLKFYHDANYRRMASSTSWFPAENTIPVREDSALEGAIGSDHEKHRPIAPDSIGRWKKPVHSKRMKDILTLYGDEIADMLIELKYETNKDWINEIK